MNRCLKEGESKGEGRKLGRESHKAKEQENDTRSLQYNLAWVFSLRKKGGLEREGEGEGKGEGA